MAGLVDFQDEEQVKSFLENMKVECHYQCYREKDPDGECRPRSRARRGGARAFDRDAVTWRAEDA